ncbi:isocitrate lyase/PEP mutase family protein [Modestobacter lapidis]|nr:isocitrate lyase/phosphoenolpyruvate mutase family protein [Modestobacter lapidis]
MSHQAAFAGLHRSPVPFLLPNAWDVASALLLQDAGFPAVGTTSLGVTAAAGLPDGAGAGRDLTIALAETLAVRLRVPVTVDLEGGYCDDPREVARIARRLADAGVAGVNLEDGRPDGSLRPAAEHAAVIAAVTAAAPDLFVNARTDTYWLEPGPAAGRPAETGRRLRIYRDAGAAGVFVPGLTDPAVVATLVAEVALPLNLLWQPGATLAGLGAVGVRRVSTGSALYRSALAAAVATARAAAEGGPSPLPAIGYGPLQQTVAAAPPARER